MKTIKIDNKIISDTGNAFVIAEAGVNYYDIANHKGITPLAAAKLMISQAAKAGADAIKFQTYKACKLAVRNSSAYWDTSKEPTRSQYELFSKYDKFSEKEYRELAEHSKTKGIVFMSTPFDHDAVEFLDELMPAFKIASADITNIPLIEHIASKGKPILFSTGAATFQEISAAVCTIRNKGNEQIVIMHCVLNYPTWYHHANLFVIERLRKMFPEYIIGYSDHTAPDTRMLVLLIAYVLGAIVLEKHFTLDKSLSGNDHYHSMDTKDLKIVRKNLQVAREILGDGEKNIEVEAQARLHARRSIVALVDIPKGTKITSDLLTCKRPGTGISPNLWDSVVGKTAKADIFADEIISRDKLK